MAISPLPLSTINLLGSAQTLTTPVSLVKELIDNALDARATTIDVLISKDTLEKIEVRDNGQGISQADLDSLGRRGHTSKLRSFEELRSIGGTSLGFRGEALASAVQLGEVCVTTKTEGESVATCVTLKSSGGTLTQQRASHPVGTTVCVKRFSYKLPVRKQTALKAAPRTIVQIKELLQSFAFARVSVKFSFKIVKESKASWSYVPRAGGTIKDAAVQIIGKDAAAECCEETISFSEQRSGEASKDIAIQLKQDDSLPGTSSPSGRFTLQVFLPKRGADMTNLSRGQYVSIDSRPVASDKGTIKRIVTVFKSYLKNSQETENKTIKNPFLRMNINCPVSSYDPNVEPAKDDVIFSNEHWILESIEDFFKKFYGALSTTSKLSSSKPHLQPQEEFQLLLRRSDHHSAQEDVIPPGIPYSPQKSQNKLNGSNEGFLAQERSDQSIDDTHVTQNNHGGGSPIDTDLSRNASKDIEEACFIELQNDLPLKSPSTTSLNPWVIARLTGSEKSQSRNADVLPQLERHSWDPSVEFLPTPKHSSDPVGFDDGESIDADLPNERFSQADSNLDLSLALSRQNDRVNLPLPFASHVRVQHGNLTRQIESHAPVHQVYDPVKRHNDFITARNIRDDSPAQSTVPDSINIPKKRAGKVNRPCVPPLIGKGISASQERLHQTTIDNSLDQSPEMSVGHVRGSEKANDRMYDDDDDLRWAMEFEHRKEILARQQREKLKQLRAKATARSSLEDEQSTKTRTSPHKNRYMAAITNLDKLPHPSLKGTETQPSAISDADPRGYLIRHEGTSAASLNSSGEPNRPVRLKSNRLPFERIPVKDELHTLALELPATLMQVESFVQALGDEDSYIQDGKLVHGISIDAIEREELINRLQEVIEYKKDTIGKEIEIEYTFENVLITDIET